MKEHHLLGYSIAALIILAAMLLSYQRDNPPAIMMSIGDQK
ncbi:hypothetical protein [Rhizobium phage RHEph12]|nr:hypothetical protein [Rhizobium phage RHEph12]